MHPFLSLKQTCSFTKASTEFLYHRCSTLDLSTVISYKILLGSPLLTSQCASVLKRPLSAHLSLLGFLCNGCRAGKNGSYLPVPSLISIDHITKQNPAPKGNIKPFAIVNSEVLSARRPYNPFPNKKHF